MDAYERRRRLDRTRTKLSDTSNFILGAIVIIIFAVGIGGCKLWLRNKTISDCEGRGGQAITHSWYQSGDSNGNGGYFDVTCLEPRKTR
jgi:hypothetical protein